MKVELWVMFFLAYLVTTLSPGPNFAGAEKQPSAWVEIRIYYRVGKSLLPIADRLFGCRRCWASHSGVALLVRDHEDDRRWLPHIFRNQESDGVSKSKVRFCGNGIGDCRSQIDRKSVFRSVFVSASNPKTLIFLSAFLPQFLDATHPPYEQFSIMFFTICGIVTCVHLGYSYLIASFGRRFSFKDFGRKIDKITGGLFITMGGGVLLSDRV